MWINNTQYVGGSINWTDINRRQQQHQWPKNRLWTRNPTPPQSSHDDVDDDLQREEIVFAIKCLLLEYNQFVDHWHVCAWASVCLVGEWREIVSVSRLNAKVHFIPINPMHSIFVFILSSSWVLLFRSSFSQGRHIHRHPSTTAAPLCLRFGSRVVKWVFIGQFGFKSSLFYYYYVEPLFFSLGNWEADVQEHNVPHYYITWWGWRRAAASAAKDLTNHESSKKGRADPNFVIVDVVNKKTWP